MTGVLTDQVPAVLDGERLDRVVAIMSGRSRSAVRAMIEAGDVDWAMHDNATGVLLI